MKHLSRGLAACLIMTGLGWQPSVPAATIAVIGTGNVGGALGPEFAQQGHTIVYGSRDPGRTEVQELVARTGGNASATSQSEAAVDADIVVLAVPGDVAEEVIQISEKSYLFAKL